MSLRNPAKKPENAKVRIISRNEIPSLHKIKVKGKTHNLGILKDLRKHSVLAEFMPEQGRLSLSWVNLKEGETLNPHEHPTSSMIIVCEGEGEIIGDHTQPLKTGDIAAIPPSSKHGFIGRGKAGFWGLSVQFEGLGLYENREVPRVDFVEPTGENSLKPSRGFDTLIRDQHNYESLYKRFILLKFLKSPHVQEPEVQERLLEILNYWANWFQRIIFARAAVGNKSGFQDIAEDHIREEVGHNKNLLAARGNKPINIWDPVLESGASWFYEKMLSGTDAERTILIHFVLEGSGEIFHREAAKVFPHIDHFRAHGEDDDEHFEMGCRLLRETPNLDFNALRDTLRQGWSIMQMICNRMAHVSIHGTKDKVL